MTDDGGGLRPLDLLASGANLVGDGLAAATVFTRARLVRPLRPDRPPRALAAVQRWGLTPAGGYAAAAALYPDAEAVVDERGALTFREIDDRSNRLANVKDDLAGYKVPQRIVFVDELPRNAAGKVLKRELEEAEA